MHEHVRRMFAEAGLDYAPPPDVVPNTFAALRLTELARDLGRQRETHDRLMDAYWAEGENIGDRDVLQRLAGELGLPAADADRVLAGDDYADRVRASTREAASVGITGIPAFLLGGRLLVLGAHPRETFERALEQIGAG